jgi:hypothetical protein
MRKVFGFVLTLVLLIAAATLAASSDTPSGISPEPECKAGMVCQISPPPSCRPGTICPPRTLVPQKKKK